MLGETTMNKVLHLLRLYSLWRKQLGFMNLNQPTDLCKRFWELYAVTDRLCS